VSGTSTGQEVELGAVNGAAGSDGGVAYGARLLAFTEAVMSADPEAIDSERKALREVLTPAAFVDTCATIGAFNVVDRVADATGIPLDPPLAVMSKEVRDELDLARFASSANSPGA